MILVKKFPLGLFWEKMGLEVVPDDYLVRKQAVLDYKIMYLHMSPYLQFFHRG